MTEIDLDAPIVDMAAVVDALDPDRKKPEVAYRFSNGREFERPASPYTGVSG